MSKSSLGGMDKLIKKLNSLEKAVSTKILRTELRAGAKEIAVEIKALAPVGETGNLRRAIKVRGAKRKKGRIGFVAQIGAGNFKGDTFYGAMANLGTSKQPAQHFMERGFDAKVEQLKQEIPARIAAAIQKEVK